MFRKQSSLFLRQEKLQPSDFRSQCYDAVHLRTCGPIVLRTATCTIIRFAFLIPGTMRLILSTALALSLAWHGKRKKSLSTDGAIAAFIVGFVTFASGSHFGFLLIAFFISSSWLTKYKSSTKRQIEHDFKEGGQRNAIQVFSNSLTASFLCLSSFLFFDNPILSPSHCNCIETVLISNCFLHFAFLAFYSCCAGDTWSSELGVLSTDSPFLITSGRRVPKGTNGGVSLLGLFSSVAGGGLMGLVWFLVDVVQSGRFEGISSVIIGLTSGLVGSLLDSLLGATLQYSGWLEEEKKVVNRPLLGAKHISGFNVLNNEQVNLLSASVTAALVGSAVCFLYC